MAIDCEGHHRVMEDFVAAILENRAPRVDGREGRQSLDLVLAIYRSAGEGQTAMMMKKFETLRRIVDSGLVAVIRADSADQAIQLAEACHKGGVAAIEVAFTVHGAEEAIRELSRRFSRGEFVLGAGTVLDPETARMAMLAGAQYVVTPA